jgi:hypothetical protein
MSKPTIVIDEQLMTYVQSNTEDRIRFISKVIAPMLALLLGFSLFFVFKLVELASEVNYTTPVFVKPDRSVISIAPAYRPDVTLRSIKDVSEQYAAELMSLNFRKIVEQLQRRKVFFVNDDAFDEYYLTPLDGTITDKGSVEWIKGNNLIVTAAASPNSPPICTNYYLVDGWMRYHMKVDVVQSFIGPSSTPVNRELIIYMTLKEVPRAVNINGVQIETLGMKTI